MEGNFSFHAALAEGTYWRLLASMVKTPGTCEARLAEWTSEAPGQVRSCTQRKDLYFWAAAAIKTAWTNDPATHTGPFVSFRDVHTGPRPLRTPHPPIWVGGASDAALRRAVRLGDAWHPIRIRVPWLRDTGLPRLREIADKEGRPRPALCPRIRLRITDSAVAEDGRIAGDGSLDQVRADLEALAALGASYVLLDTYTDDPEATRHHEPAWRMLATLAERVLDLPRETLR